MCNFGQSVKNSGEGVSYVTPHAVHKGGKTAEYLKTYPEKRRNYPFLTIYKM